MIREAVIALSLGDVLDPDRERVWLQGVLAAEVEGIEGWAEAALCDLGWETGAVRMTEWLLREDIE